jgi:hypothetical protein
MGIAGGVEMMTKLRERYYNPADQKKRSHLLELMSGSVIVCAARPVPGEQTWEGDWCGGIHWAAASIEQFEKYEKIWRDLDAARIVLVDNDRIVELAEIEYAERVKDPSHYAPAYPGWQQSLEKYGAQRLCQMLVPEAPWQTEEF